MTSAPTTILLLDHEPMLRELTARMLERRGARVQEAASLAEAIAHARDHLFDVGVVDVPDGSSEGSAGVLDALQLSDCLPRRVVLCTHEQLPEEQASRAWAVLQKPFDFDALVSAVFGPTGARRRPTQSGLFPRMRACVRTPRRAAQGRRGRG